MAVISEPSVPGFGRLAAACMNITGEFTPAAPTSVYPAGA
jgi:hypothetical protein